MCDAFKVYQKQKYGKNQKIKILCNKNAKHVP